MNSQKGWCCMVLLTLLLSTVADAATAERSLSEAQTRYQLALSTDVAAEELREAARLYQQVLDTVGTNDTPEAARLRRAAQVGLDQTEPRLANADEMFRNVWPGAWLLAGDHGAFERFDDATELAVERAWLQVQDTLDFNDRPIMGVYPRCAGSEEQCGILRDMVVLATEDNPKVRGISDDRMQLLLGADLELGAVGSTPSAAVTARLRDRLPDGELLLADIQVHPNILIPDRVSRAGIRVFRWAPATGTFGAVAYEEDVGIDVVNRDMPSRGLTLLGLFIGLVGAAGMRLTPAQGRSVLWGLGLSVLGFAGAFGLFMATESLLPEMNDLAVDAHGIPLFKEMLWPLLVGILLAVGPTVITLVGSLVLKLRAGGFVDVGMVDWRRAPVVVQLAAAIFVVSELPLLLGSHGWLLAGALVLALVLPAIATGAVAARLLEPEGVPSGGLAAAGVCVASQTVAFLAFGLGMEPLVVAMTGGLGGLFGLVLTRQIALGEPKPVAGFTPASEREAHGALSRLHDVGNLSRPRFVPRASLPLAPLGAWAADTTGAALLLVRGASGAGKSRLCEAALAGLNVGVGAKSTARPHEVVDTPTSDATPPLHILTQLLRGILPVLERVAIIERQREVMSAMAEVGGLALDGVPGVGLLVGLLPADGEGPSTREQLQRDVDVAVRQALSAQSLVWFIDDAQSMDSESREALRALVSSLRRAPAAHPLVCIASEQREAADGTSSLDGLQSDFGTGARVIDLQPMNDTEQEELLANTGLQDVTTEHQAFLDSYGRLPADILSLLQHLEHEALLIQCPAGGFRLPSGAALTELETRVPAKLLERELARLQRLPKSTVLLLEMAAQCGRRFEAEDLAAGLGEGRFQVLERLRVIELEHGLIEDLDEDDLFAFVLEPTRQACLHRTHRRDLEVDRSGRVLPELARAFHASVARSLEERFETSAVSAERIVRHLAQAGPRETARVVQWQVVAAEQAARVFAWDRALRIAEQALQGASSANEAIRHRLHLILGKALRAVGGQANRNRSRTLLQSLFDSPHVDPRGCLEAWLEVVYEEKEKKDLQAICDFADAHRARAWRGSWMGETLAFYELLARFELQPRSEDGLRAFLDRMRALQATLLGATGAEAPANKRTREGLLSRVESELLNKLGQLRPATPEEETEWETVFARVVSLKESLRDLDGLATVYGVAGNRMLWGKKDYARAAEYFQKDLEVVERSGARQQQASLYNRLAWAVYESAKAGRPLPIGGVEHAIALAQESLQVAQDLAREKDAAYAAAAILRFQVEQKRPASESEAALAVLWDDTSLTALGSRDRHSIGAQLRELSGHAEEPLRTRLHDLAGRLLPAPSEA